MAEHDDPRADEITEDDPGDEVGGFGLFAGMADGSVLPNPTNLGGGAQPDIRVTKKTDASSPLLILKCADGQHISG